MQVDLLNDTLTFNIEIHKNDYTDFQTLKFIDVSAFYYVKDNLENRFNFYDREKVYYLEMTTIDHVEKKKCDFQIKSTSDEEWGENHTTDANVVIEIWDSVLFIEARRVEVENQVFDLKQI
ncbi:hypothetical protein BCM40_06640 [Planococcus donghaensis]|uniref:Uncharacterized protein n=2 Tax=Planococcus donghaensis TaxID=414778 RepID=A0A1C7ENC5_9BACL|nr:hypothetical protein BCM40_06640 [Planococcus donghaensis]